MIVRRVPRAPSRPCCTVMHTAQTRECRGSDRPPCTQPRPPFTYCTLSPLSSAPCVFGVGAGVGAGDGGGDGQLARPSSRRCVLCVVGGADKTKPSFFHRGGHVAGAERPGAQVHF